MSPVPAARTLACAALLVAARAVAQTEAPASRLDAAARQAVVDTIAAQLERFYVDADTGRLIAARLRDRRAARAYDRMVTTSAFAEALTSDLRSINGDLHLGVQYAPDLPTEHPGGLSLIHI